MSTLTELGDFLEQQGLGTQGENLFLGSRPDGDPDTLLVVYSYPGGEPEYVQEKMAPNQERAQVQVVARAIKYDVADALAARAWRALASVTNATLSGTRYRSIRPNASPGIIGRDTNDRTLIGFNASVEKEVSLVA